MSTLRKLRVKLANTGIQKGKPPQQKLLKRSRARTNQAFHCRDTGHHPDGNCHHLLRSHSYSIFLLLPLAVRPKIICRTQFVHLHISEPTPIPSGTQRQTMPGTFQSRQPVPQKCSSGAAAADIVKNFAICLSNSPSEIWPNIHFVFYPAGSSPKKRKRQATADPDSETTSFSINTTNAKNMHLHRDNSFKRMLAPKYPRPHQQQEHRPFIPRAVPRHRFLGAPMRPNTPASQADQAIQASFILHKEFLAPCCPRAKSITRPEASDGELRDQVAVQELLGRGPATTLSHTPPASGTSWNATDSSPSGAFCTWSIRRTRPWTSPTSPCST